MRYELPLFFLVVKTNVNYIVVGSFIIQRETTASIQEALGIFHDWTGSWKPQYFMTDFCHEEIMPLREHSLVRMTQNGSNVLKYITYNEHLQSKHTCMDIRNLKLLTKLNAHVFIQNLVCLLAKARPN